LSLAELKRLIRSNMKKLSGKNLVQLAIPVCYQFVRPFLLRRKNVAIRHLGQLVIFLQLQSFVQVSKRLLLRNQLDVIRPGVSRQLANLICRQRTSRRSNQRMRAAAERVLHIKGVHVQFEGRKRAQLTLYVIDRGHRPAADII
jgi:hypothetical protein